MKYQNPELKIMKETMPFLACLSGTAPGGIVTKGALDINCGAGAAPSCGVGTSVGSAGACTNGPTDAKAYFIAPASCNAGTRFSNSGSDCAVGGGPTLG